MTPSRRTTIKWMMTAAALPLARQLPVAHAAGAETPPPFRAIAPWPPALPPMPPARGYGRDPTLMEPKVTWPLTLTRAQRATVDLLGDMILPADAQSPGAGALGIGAFIDEWISAPYPNQQRDRVVILGGLAWLDEQSKLLHGQPFAAAAPAQRAELLDALSVEVPAGAMVQPVAFMDRLRGLFVLGFYSLPEGKADMGHIGDQPTPGPYPGPTPEALAHLDKLLKSLKLPSVTA